jgi:hypothetical protein
VHPIHKKASEIKIEQAEEDGSWAQFEEANNGGTSEQVAAPVNRFELIHDAFAELIDSSPAKEEERKAEVEVEEDGFDEYVSVEQTPSADVKAVSSTAVLAQTTSS